MLRQKLPNLLNTIGGLGAAAPKLSCRGAPRRLVLRVYASAPHTLKGGQFPAGRSPAHYFSAKPKKPPVVFCARRRSRRRAAPLHLWSGAVFPPPAFGAEADKVRHRQQQKKTFLISRRRRGFSDGIMLGKMTTKRPYTEEQVAAWARAKRLARARWCRGRRRDCYGEFRGEAPAVPFSFPTLPAFYAAPQAAAGGRTSLPSPSPRPAHTPRRVVGS